MTPEIALTIDQNLFIRKPIPEKGIVCSNAERAERIASEYLSSVETFSCSWGARVWIGNYQENTKERLFVALAPVGSGSGLVFTELFSAGAKFLVRYGSDDAKNPEPYEYKNCVKLIDETDNLYGYCQASGVDPSEWGESVMASPVLLKAFLAEGNKRDMIIERRICHHLENYHSLRNPNVFPNRKTILEKQLADLKEKANGKKESFDMESAVLFRCAKDFGFHALTVLQTVNKEDKDCDPYEGKHREAALKDEQQVFVDYIFTSLLSTS
ncbi:unnamed protein product [Cylindrotheca closterium]|uniref:Nucleoside phosphorylase domain-containing protein n=1 Tax=Cylindrotheca closterium TaxID=2856 RepID=A0AAD2G257_9STRA|nr:unnamed protein product [Cylindrotheca closterium]